MKAQKSVFWSFVSLAVLMIVLSHIVPVLKPITLLFVISLYPWIKKKGLILVIAFQMALDYPVILFASHASRTTASSITEALVTATQNATIQEEVRALFTSIFSFSNVSLITILVYPFAHVFFYLSVYSIVKKLRVWKRLGVEKY